MKKLLWASLLLTACQGGADPVESTSGTAAAETITRPKLVVGVVVDQMKKEYLDRFAEHYGDGGFKR
ncbi:MAG: alkaline phosphatase family protein, partial [Bacteroidota bacterium]